jgi:hypothetical protein
MRAAHGLSRTAGTAEATKEALSAAAAALGNGDPVIAAQVYFGADRDASLVARVVAEALPGVPFIGCSTDGEISGAGLSVDSVCVMLLASRNVKARTAAVAPLSKDSHEAGAELARRLQSKDDIALFLLPDGLTGNGSAIIRGAQSVLGQHFVIAGGTAGDRGRFSKTWQVCNGESHTDALVGMMLSSAAPVEVGYGVMSGWRPMGVAKTVTEAVDNTVFRIEGETALDVYSTFLGEKASQLPAIGVEYPFALVDESGLVDERGLREGEEYILLRAPMSVDREKGAVSFAAEIPQGAKIKMTRAKSDEIIDGSREAARRAVKGLAGKPDVVFFFSCMARKVVLGRRTNKEIEAAQEVFGTDVPLIGFYTYGEIANCGEKNPICRFHNETATFLALREG